MSTRELESLVSAAQAEVSRQMQVCNACRYCESFCAVFPAMTRRLEFGAADVHYLANLCHNCGACLHACQYAPPHEFAVNVPQAMAAVRSETYEQFAWPRAMGELYRRNGLTVALITAMALVQFFVLLVWSHGTLWHPPLGGRFYAVFPHGFMVAVFGIAFGFALLSLGISTWRFWKTVRPEPVEGQKAASTSSARTEAAVNALTLTYLDGGHGEGCNEADDRFTLARRRFHHFTFYGFMLCFASTCVATLYHYAFGWQAPYAFTSLPVILGTLGGIGLLIGPAGLLWLNLRRHPMHREASQQPMDRAFIALLLLSSVSGLALLVLRNTPAMAALLAAHLGIVLALFLTMPYGKFAHAVYRCAALLKYTIEKRRPSRLAVGTD